MPEGQVLEFSGVTKRFGGVTAVTDLTARVEPGLVTGFLGPNGAGKTTSLRVLLGLVRPTAGTATIGGVRYAKLPKPLHTVGAVLEASSFHPGRSAAAHLTVYAQAAGLPRSRVDEVLGLVGLSDAAGRKVGGYSLGMRQRLGLAYALLGDPGVLVLDEPTNGLDPEGIRWIRGFLRELAREGRTVFVSSHLLAEVQQTVDSLLIISRGRLVFQGGLDELSDPSEQATVVDSDDRAALADALRADGIPFEVLRSGLTVRGIDPAAVGRAAAAAGVALTALQKRGPALEEVFLDLVNGTRVHASATGADTIPALGAGAVAAETDASADASGTEPHASAGDPAKQPVADDAAEDADPAGVSGVADAEPAEVAGAADDAILETAVADAEPAEVAGAPDDAILEATGDADSTDAGVEAPTAEGESATAVWADDRRAASHGDHPAFAVASTGVIDIVIDEEPPAPDDAPLDEPADTAAASGQGAGDEHPAFVVAVTGVIDIITVEDAPAEAAPVEDAPAEDSPVETAADATADGDDRPWDPYVKTESDRDADRFFAAFDEAAEREAANRAAAEGLAADAAVADEPPTEPGAGPEPDGAPEAENADEVPEAQDTDHTNRDDEGGDAR